MAAIDLEITQRGYVPAEQVAKIFGVSTNCLARWRSAKDGPAYYKVAGRIFYRAEDLEAFIERSRVATTPATPAARHGSTEQEGGR